MPDLKGHGALAPAYPAEQSGAPNYWRFAPLGLIVATLGFAYAMGWHRFLSLEQLSQSRDALKGFVDGHLVLAATAFALLYFMATAIAFPASALLTVAGGFLFGWIGGLCLVEIGAVTGATALFLAARSAFGEGLRRRIGPRAERLAEGFEKDAFSYLLVLRLAPFLPFFVVNIAPALFRVRLRDFVSATSIGILPGVAAYTYLGRGLDSVLVAANAAGRDASLADLATPEISIAFAALAAVALGATALKRVLASRRAAPS